MNIQLPVEIVDGFVDIVLGKHPEVSYEREVISSPSKICYNICFVSMDTAPWKIQIHPLGKWAEITFPLFVQESEVYPSQISDGGTMEIAAFEPPVYTDPVDKAKHHICSSIYLRLKMQELQSPDGLTETLLPDTQKATAQVDEDVETKTTKVVETNQFIQIPPIYQEDLEKVRDYSLKGKYTIKQIASATGLSVSTVNRYRKKLGITRK
jgi:hypothetical protein